VARTPDTRRGEAFRRWLHGLPRTTRRLVVAGLVIGWLALWYAALFAADSAFGEDDVSWADPLPSMVGAVVGGGFVLWLQRRRMGSFTSVWDFDRAVRRRRLPDDADPAEWGPLLAAGHRFQRGARRFALGFTLLVLIATVLLLAWGGYGWPVVAAAGLIGAALVAVLEIAGGRRSRRIERLQDQLHGLSDQGALTPGD
jgi:hypothetical protein